MKFKEFVKTVKKPNWISSVFVKDKNKDIHDLLQGFTGVYKLNPSIKRKINDAEVVEVHKSGPYCKAYSYAVTLDLVVSEVRDEHRVIVTFQDGTTLYSSTNDCNH